LPVEEVRFRFGVHAARFVTKPRVLICEEDAEVIGSIASVLEADGFDTLQVPYAGATWDDARPLDFALLDISPPHRDNMALARRLAHARVPFVVLSERDDATLVERAIEAGAMGCFFKPLQVATIVPSIRAWIARANELASLQQERWTLLEALRHHRSIGTAVGIIMERHGLAPDDAFETLRRHARNERQSVARLASAVVAGVPLPAPTG
jgi:two-component system, response regulator PdtaR